MRRRILVVRPWLTSFPPLKKSNLQCSIRKPTGESLLINPFKQPHLIHITQPQHSVLPPARCFKPLRPTSNGDGAAICAAASTNPSPVHRLPDASTNSFPTTTQPFRSLPSSTTSTTNWTSTIFVILATTTPTTRTTDWLPSAPTDRVKSVPAEYAIPAIDGRGYVRCGRARQFKLAAASPRARTGRAFGHQYVVPFNGCRVGFLILHVFSLAFHATSIIYVFDFIKSTYPSCVDSTYLVEPIIVTPTSTSQVTSDWNEESVWACRCTSPART